MMLASRISANEAKFRIQIINVFLSVGRVVQLNPCAWFTMRHTGFYGASALHSRGCFALLFCLVSRNCFLAVCRFVCCDDEADRWHNVVAGDDNGGGDGGLQLKCQALLFHKTLKKFFPRSRASRNYFMILGKIREVFFLSRFLFGLVYFFCLSLLLFLRCESNDSSGFTVRIMIYRRIWCECAFVLLEFPCSVFGLAIDVREKSIHTMRSEPSMLEQTMPQQQTQSASSQ